MRTNLKVLRVKHQLTQEQMAEAIHVGRQTYAAVEKGRLRGSESFWTSVQETFEVPNESMWGLMQDE